MKSTDSNKKRSSTGLISRLRAYFFAGVLVTAPAAITFYVAWAVIDFIDRQITPWLPPRYNPETYLPFGVPGLGLLILVLGLTAIGALTATAAGSALLARGITRPLSQLAEVARVIANGDYSRAATVERDDEVGALARAVNAPIELRYGP